MPKWTAVLLAGALGWPAVSYGQGIPADLPPVPMRPTETPVLPATAPVDSPMAVQQVAAESPTPDAFVPPLPPSKATAQAGPKAPTAEKKEPLPAPKAAPAPMGSSGQKVVVPDVSGMPMPGQMPCGVMPPSTCVPIPPPPCPPPCPIPEPCCENDCGLLIWGDALFLRPNRRDPAAYMQYTDQITTTTQMIGYDADHTYAYRVGGGWLAENGWLFTASYTQFKDDVSDQIFLRPDVNPANQLVLGYVGPGQLYSQTINQPGALTTSWNLQYRTLDVSFGSVYSPSCNFDLIVSGGARFAWIDQEYRTAVDTLVTAGSLQAEALNLNTRGAGPRLGCEARLYVLPWWALYGRGHASILLTHRTDESLLVTSLTGANLDAVSVVQYQREELMPMLELAIGTEVTAMNGRLLLGAGYEANYYWELASSAVDAIAQPGVISHNGLSLDGFYARVMLLF